MISTLNRIFINHFVYYATNLVKSVALANGKTIAVTTVVHGDYDFVIVQQVPSSLEYGRDLLFEFSYH